MKPKLQGLRANGYVTTSFSLAQAANDAMKKGILSSEEKEIVASGILSFAKTKKVESLDMTAGILLLHVDEFPQETAKLILNFAE